MESAAFSEQIARLQTRQVVAAIPSPLPGQHRPRDAVTRTEDHQRDACFVLRHQLRPKHRIIKDMNRLRESGVLPLDGNAVLESGVSSPCAE